MNGQDYLGDLRQTITYFMQLGNQLKRDQQEQAFWEKRLQQEEKLRRERENRERVFKLKTGGWNEGQGQPTIAVPGPQGGVIIGKGSYTPGYGTTLSQPQTMRWGGRDYYKEQKIPKTTYTAKQKEAAAYFGTPIEELSTDQFRQYLKERRLIGKPLSATDRKIIGMIRALKEVGAPKNDIIKALRFEGVNPADYVNEIGTYTQPRTFWGKWQDLVTPAR